jgi:hypothetical protein
MAVRDAFRSGHSSTGGGYALWVFRGGVWTVQKLECGEGYQAGDPPRQQGRFEGEVVKKACEPDLSSTSSPPESE